MRANACAREAEGERLHRSARGGMVHRSAPPRHEGKVCGRRPKSMPARSQILNAIIRHGAHVGVVAAATHLVAPVSSHTPFTLCHMCWTPHAKVRAERRRPLASTAASSSSTRLRAPQRPSSAPLLPASCMARSCLRRPPVQPSSPARRRSSSLHILCIC